MNEGKSPEERTGQDAKAIPAVAKPAPDVQKGELTDEALGKVAGGSIGSSVLTNIANMKHESLKGIAQNLRG